MKEGKMRLNLMQMGVWAKRVRVKLGNAYEDVVVQTIGDRTAVLEAGHEAMQKKLLEFRADGERYAALTEALRLSSAEELAGFVVEGERRAIAERVAREMRPAVEPRRDMGAGESESDFAIRHGEWEAQCTQLQNEREAELARRVQERYKELCLWPKEQLVEQARARRIDAECWNAFRAASDDYVILEATRLAEDAGRLYFADIEEVRRLHPEVKLQLAKVYRELETAAGGEEGTDDLPKD
jgi:hypothetical protein